VPVLLHTFLISYIDILLKYRSEARVNLKKKYTSLLYLEQVLQRKVMSDKEGKELMGIDAVISVQIVKFT